MPAAFLAAVVSLFVAATGAPAVGLECAPDRPVHTFSIVARDSVTGELGVAVQSHWYNVGASVPWAEAGVGAVATQSFVDPAYGTRGLALMRSGLSASAALDALVREDPGEAVRQVGFVDAQGRVAAHTGARCIDAAGHHTGRGYSVQANMMLSDRIWPEMARAYEAALARGDDLIDRLLAALDAAQAAGGDIRGRQSAAILVVKGENTGRPWADRVLDLRVEDNPDPLVELRRLVVEWRAYEDMNQGDLAVEKGDMPGALAHYAAADKALPDNLEVRYWHAVTLATNGHVEEALPIFRQVFAADPNWAELTRRLIKPGLIPDTPDGKKLLARILAESKSCATPEVPRRGSG